MAEHVDVAVAFRRLLGPAREPFEVSAIEPGVTSFTPQFAPSSRSLGQFIERRFMDFGVVFEGSWTQSGKLAAWCAQRGVPSVPVIDRLPTASWLAPIDGGREWLAFAGSGRYLRRAPVVVTSGEDLRSAITQRWRVDADRITVIAPPVDRALFAPADQQEARRRLGLAPDQLILVAGDGLGAGSDLGLLIEAVQRAGDPSLRLHVLGDGDRRMALERLAGPGGVVRFHGHVPDERVAEWIAAADLCVFVDEHGESAFTVRECLAAGRPAVVMVPGHRTHSLVRHRATGFLVANDLVGWIRFLQAECPSRKALRAMGLTASQTPLQSLDQAAAAYLDVIHRVRTGASTPAAIA